MKEDQIKKKSSEKDINLEETIIPFRRKNINRQLNVILMFSSLLQPFINGRHCFVASVEVMAACHYERGARPLVDKTNKIRSRHKLTDKR